MGKTDDRSRGKSKREALVVAPPRLVEMTEEQYRQAVRLLVTLVDSFVGRHGAATSGPQRSNEVGPDVGPATREQEPPRAQGKRPLGGAGQPSHPSQDLFAEAVELWRAQPDKRDQLGRQLANVEAEIRKNEGLIKRYLLAFEAGTLPEIACGDRVHALTEIRAALRVHREEVAARLTGCGTDEDADCLDGVDLGSFLRQVIDDKVDLPIVKALLQILIEDVTVEGRQAIYPTIRIPPGRSTGER